jgi:hypothetical protein
MGGDVTNGIGAIIGITHRVNRGEDMLRCLYKDYNSLNGWQANRDLLSAIYFFVTTHRQKGKKISIFPPGDVNPGPIPSR